MEIKKLTSQIEDSKKRFSDRVVDYVKYRPSYPVEILSFLGQNHLLTKNTIIADIGSGTGILTKLFLDNGNKVFGIEPNNEMRLAGEKYLKKYTNFVSITGSAEKTTLSDHSVDVITAGQAYHWFNVEETAKEFIRILKKSDKNNIFLIWNTRSEKTAFNKELEALIQKYSKDYKQVSQTEDKNKANNIFFNKEFSKKIFPNSQELTFDGLLGRLLSASYMIKKDDPLFEQFKTELKELFEKYQNDGKVTLVYETELFYGKIT